MFVIETPFLDLEQIYNSGQCFRWLKFRDYKYVIPCGDQALKIEQVKERLIMSCSNDQFYDFWFEYFDMKTDYSDINYKVKRTDDYLKICANRGNGIRIVKQDLFETIITFALATSTNIPRIKCMVSALCENFGIVHNQSMREVCPITWYEFPSPDAILKKPDELDKCKLGYRRDTILGLCRDIVEGWLDLELLKTMSYSEAMDYLMEFEGIGPKVASCICLYGLHKLEAFPIDTHIEQILKREYDCDYEAFAKRYLKRFTSYAGIVQQYMFYNEINQPKEVLL